MTEKVSCNRRKPQKKRKKKTASTPKATEDLVYEFVTGDDIATCYVGVEERNCPTTPLSSCGLTAKNEDVSLDFCLSGDEYRDDMSYSSIMSGSNTELSFSLSNDQFSNADVFSYDASIPPALAGSAYDEYCFVSNFTQLLTSSRRNYSSLRPESWIPKLPYLVATNSLPSPLKYALHAVALLYHAVTHDYRAEVPAVKFYVAGIESYRSMVLGGQAKETPMVSISGEDLDPEMPHASNIVAVCGPILFSFYEALQDAGSDAEMLHHSVAIEMLQARGPEKCVDGLAHSVMRSMRVKEAFHSIMQNRSANFSSPEWLSVPFQQKHKICYDRLIDILLSFTTTLHLPHMNQRGAKLRNSIHCIHDLSTARKNDIEKNVTILQEQLKKWWLEFRDEHCEISAQNSGTSSILDAADVAAASPSSVLPLSGPWMIANKETLTSSMVSIYSAIHVILHSILLIISLSRTPGPIEPGGQSAVDIHQAAISMYATSVFNAALYLNMVNPFCGDALRTKFSINLVAQFALEDGQRDEAQRMLGQWKLRDMSISR
ncbi:hypothetical protein FP744_10009173 [Trichoderma asperellum]